MPHMSVVVPTYNRQASLIRTLEALARQSLPTHRFEVVVVSDGATDGTAAAVRSLAPPYRLRLLDQANAGPSAARNNGARAACGEVLVYLDDDVEPGSGCLEEHERAHGEDPMLVLIGPQSMPSRERFAVWVAWEHRMLEQQYARFASGEWQAGPNNLYSGNFSVRRDHLLEAGGFDERFKRQEDVELGYRLAQLGVRFRFEPRAAALHRPARTYESWYATPYLYGVRDVQMARDKHQESVMELARKHYRERSALTRAFARAVVGRRWAEAATLALLKPAPIALDRAGLRAPALQALSVLFNLRYLQGMAAEIGGGAKLWGALR